MATITTTNNEKVITMNKWLGLIESEDGDVELPTGAATICKNWKITRDRNLKRRSGYKHAQYYVNDNLVNLALGTGSVQGMWSGYINGNLEFLASCDGHIYRIYDYLTDRYIKEDLGRIDTSVRTTFFPFANAVYIMDGNEYYKYDGIEFTMVKGYRPLLYTSLTPAGAQPEDGSALERVNLLTGRRRLQYSPDGQSRTFTIIDDNLISVDYLKDTTTGNLYSPNVYEINLSNKTVTFLYTTPSAGQNTIEIGYTALNTYRSQVTKKRFAEIYSGSTDLRVMIYGDGTNQILYSEVDNDGMANVEYFPDLNQIGVGDANTPVTALMRHLSTLVVYKLDSTWSVSYGTITTALGNMEAGFYVTPINKVIGNEAYGQVQQILNNPVSLQGKDLYQWSALGYKATSLSKDERTAKRISDRIYSTLNTFDIPNVLTYDDNFHQEYYIFNSQNNDALVWNYVADAWYYYDHVPVRSIVLFEDQLVFGTNDGYIEIVDDNTFSDNGEAFESHYESGSMNFGTSYKRKFSSEMWIVIKPESRGLVKVSCRTDKKANFAEKETISSLMDFWDIDFRDFSFDVNRSPRTYRHRLKAKKFVFYKLVLYTNDATTSATVLETNYKVRYINYAK